MKRGHAGTGSKVGRIMAAPLRALCRARDLYVSSMVGLAARGSLCGAASGVPRSYCFPAPRAEEDDLAELVRAASSPKPGAVGGAEVGRVAAGKGDVGMGRIDEEKPCEFGLEVLVVPRSQRSRCGPGQEQQGGGGHIQSVFGHLKVN